MKKLGKTKQMLDIVVENILEQKDPIFIVVPSQKFGNELQRRLIGLLNEKRVPIDAYFDGSVIVGNSRVIFVTPQNLEEKKRGHRNITEIHYEY